MFVAKTPEAFVHDDDGNLLSDGRWAYAWDGWTLAAEFTPSTGAAVRRYVWNPSGRGGHRSLAAVRVGG